MIDKRLIRFISIPVFVIAGLFFSFLFLNYVLAYFLPFILALILASLIEPLVNFLHQKVKYVNRALAVFLSLALIIGIIVIIISFGASRLFFELDRLVRTMPDYQEILSQAEVLWDHDKLDEWMDTWEISPQLRATVEEGLSDVYDTFTMGLRNIFKTVQDSTRKVANFFVILFFTFLATFFMSKDKVALSKTIADIIPPKWQRDAHQFRIELSNNVIGYIRALAILISVTTVVTIIGLYLIGSNYALLLGLVSGLLDIIPILGPGLIFTPWIIYEFLFGEIFRAFMLLILYGSMVIIRSSLEPKVIGKNIGVHPLAILISLYVGLRVFGAIGVILGPAILMLTNAFIRAGLLAHFKFFKNA